MERSLKIPVKDPADSDALLAVRHRPARDGAPTILYLHGLGSTQGGEKAEFFRAAATASGLGFCSFDFRGHGESSGDFEDLTLTRCLEDAATAAAWIWHNHGGAQVVLGSSLGGLTGLWYSARYPHAVAAGLHLAPAVGVREETLSKLSAEALDDWRSDGSIAFSNDLGDWRLGWAFMEDLAAYPTEGLVRELRTPSLVLQGKLDDEVSWERVAELAESASDGVVDLHLFDDGDHRLLDRKETLWRLMTSFLSARGLA